MSLVFAVQGREARVTNVIAENDFITADGQTNTDAFYTLVTQRDVELAKVEIYFLLGHTLHVLTSLSFGFHILLSQTRFWTP